MSESFEDSFGPDPEDALRGEVRGLSEGELWEAVYDQCRVERALEEDRLAAQSAVMLANDRLAWVARSMQKRQRRRLVLLEEISRRAVAEEE